MKTNVTEFETRLSVAECGQLFRRAVDRRPLKLKAVPFKYFTPTPAQNPFAEVDGSLSPDFSVGASYQMAELYGAVILSCLARPESTRVMLSSAGNMRGRVMTNSLVKHIALKFAEADPSAVGGDVRGGAPPLPNDVARLMERVGRFEFYASTPDSMAREDSSVIWAETQQPFIEAARKDPSAFVEALAKAVIPAGGWPAYGAARTIWNLISPKPPETAAYKAVMDASLNFLRRNGVPPMRLSGHEWNHWLASGGTPDSWITRRPTPARGEVPVSDLAPGETRIVAQVLNATQAEHRRAL